MSVVFAVVSSVCSGLAAHELGAGPEAVYAIAAAVGAGLASIGITVESSAKFLKGDQ